MVANGAMPNVHYATVGHKQGKDPHPLFDTSYYTENNPDVVAHGAIPNVHYTTTGFKEDNANRDPNWLFDSSYYNANNPDVVAQGMPGLIHIDRHGWRESYRDNPENFNPNRNPSPFFNTADYFEIHEDVKIASFTNDNADPVQHMLEYGFSENRITHKFFQADNAIKVSRRMTLDPQ